MTTGLKTAVGRFVWHDLNSTDVERAKAFYTELLGWEIEVFKPGEMDYPMISAKGQQHGGFGPAQGGAPSHWLGHVVVEDADAASERAKAAGGKLVTDPMDIPDVGRIAIIQDPRGGVVSAFQPTGDAPVSEGVFAWDELYADDVEGAKRFYGQVFGWTTDEMDMGDGGTYTLFKSGETSVAGCFPQPPDSETPTHWYPYLTVDDVDASTEKAKELGATVYHGPVEVPNAGRFSVLGDPTGATFGLHKEPSS